MRSKGAASSAAQKRPASPMNDSDDSSATQTTKKRRVRRPALSNDEDIAILRAVLAVQPYRASWGQGRQKWLETAARVAADTGGEMSDDLCKGRYVNLLKRFTTPQEERKRPWPKDEELKALLEEAVAEQTKYEEEAKDEYDEKGNQRRKWQPLQAMRKAPSHGGQVEKTEPGLETTTSARKGHQKGGRKKRGGDDEENELTTTGSDAHEVSRRPTRWTAPTPGAKAPVFGGEAPGPAPVPQAPPVVSSAAVSTAAATSLASALASRAVASVTSSRVVSSPARLPQAPVPSSYSSAAPVSLPAQAANSTALIAVSAPMSRSNPVVLPAILRGGQGNPREIVPAARQNQLQNQLPTPAPWLRPAAVPRDPAPLNSDSSRSTNAPRAPTPPTSTPPRETKPDVSSTSTANASSAPRPSTASPREQQQPVDRSRNDRGYASSRENNSRPNHEMDDGRGRQQTANRQMRPEPMNGGPPRTSTPPRQLPPVQQPPAQMSMPHRLGLVPPPGRFPLNRYSPPIQGPPPQAAPVRDSTQLTPPRSLPATQATSSAQSTVTNSAAPSRDNNTSASRSQPPDNRTSSASSFPRFQGATSVESMLLCVLDRLSDMEKARLEDTREERELKKRELEMRNRSGPGASPGSANHRQEFEELTRTTTSLSTSFAVSRQEQQELQMEVSRLGPFLQASQRERAQLQQDVSLLTTQLKSVHRERDELKSDLAAVVKTVKLLQSALLEQDLAFENYKNSDALARRRELDAQQELVTRQLEQFQDALQVDRRKREEVLLLIQKERDLNEAQHRERLRQLDARGADSGKSRDKTHATPVPANVEAELAELRVAIDVERSEREREYTNLLQNIKQILAPEESG